MRQLRLLVALTLLTTACGAPEEPPSWKVFPLQRYSPHDGLAVVNQPDGYGLHIFLETDTSDPESCEPRWLPDPAANGAHSSLDRTCRSPKRYAGHSHRAG